MRPALGAIPLFPLAVAAVLLCGLLLAVAWAPMQREQRLRKRIAELQDSGGRPAAPSGAAGGAIALGARIAGPIGSPLTRSGLLSASTIASLESTLAVAGLRGGQALPAFVGAKLLLLVGLPLVAWLGTRHLGVGAPWSRVLPVAAAIFALLTPDFALRLVRRRYVASVERAMPDALDLLVICAEAGLALEQGMERVAHEIGRTSRPCAIELQLTHNELRIFSDRRTALLNLARRTGLLGLQRLAGTLAQALHYGTPLSQALRMLAADLRAEALTRFEARAARLPVLMTLLMILFILPCVFLVVAGPAMLAVLETLRRQ